MIARFLGSSAARFLLGGVVTYAITLALMAFWLGLVGAPRLVAYALTHATSLCVAFVLNRRWVFRATAGRQVTQGLRFALAQAGFRALDWCLFTLISLAFLPPVFLGVLAANVLVLPAKYVFYRHHVFPEGQAARGVPAERVPCPE
jgi:putative flippase GtrA